MSVWARAADRRQQRREPERAAQRHVEQQPIAGPDVVRPRDVEAVAHRTSLVVHGELREAGRARRGERDQQVLGHRLVVDGPVSVELVPRQHGAADIVPCRIAIVADDDDRLQRAGPGVGRQRTEADAGELVDGDQHAGLRALQRVAQLVGAVAGVEADDGHPEARRGRDQLEPLQPVGQPAHDRPVGRRPGRRQAGGEGIGAGDQVTDRQRPLLAVALARHDVVGPRRGPVGQQRRERRGLTRTTRCPTCRR